MQLSQLACLAISMPKEPLYLYMASSASAITAALVRDDNGVQQPVYFVCCALHDAKPRYQPLEKLALALVHTTKKLQPYFQLHSINVLTDSPLRQVLLKPEASRRLMK